MEVNNPAPSPIVPNEPSLEVILSITLIALFPKSTIPFIKLESKI